MPHRSLPLHYATPPELRGETAGRRPVVIVGGGPVGLAAAIDCGLHGIPVLLLDEDDAVSTGSRAICWSKRTLEIFDRLGVAGRMLAKGITWKVGKLFHRDRLVYQFDLLPEAGHKMPAFINLQQYFVEEYLIERAAELPSVEMRWKSRVVGLTAAPDGVTLEVETPEGCYAVEADWVLACDGARSPLRKMMGLSFEGQVFKDRFLIADLRMAADFPTERWFWFDPPFHPGQSALLHRQADDVFRIDLQLGWDVDPEEEKKPERVIPRLRAMLGEAARFDLEWVSVYTFQCRRLERFRHGRVLFVGDSAHQVSPFGARGGNGGIQDADNLVWKLALVLRGAAPETLLDSYDEERIRGADENIRNSTRSTDFITPKGPGATLFRDAVLGLADDAPFARRLVNSGRLSLPCALDGLALQTPDSAEWEDGAGPGLPCPDAPIREPNGAPGWLLNELGHDFVLLVFADSPADLPDCAALKALQHHPAGLRELVVATDAASFDGDFAVLTDAEGLARRRYGGRPGSVHLIRPDQHVAARWPVLDEGAVWAALDRATGRAATPASAAA
ncbi:FAD-dependent oxidoreductase [Azospirillum soli]|uniref:FAD-dependent oxidoreductase n=1 Tax=Azospirillum soli TaxID=1304799 RepID=UPI001AE61714|nr:FAD-dependent oxidoreductase [Azospirillum soli]MBP2313119.1 3-(3-hydroxy-phenyl)propionate hydroxylase [Azospirillum soli]